MKNKKDDLNFMGLSPESILMLREIKKKEENGEELDPQTIEALKAIDLASRVVNTIMSGNQIDPVFFKRLSDITQERIELASGTKKEKKKLKKNKKFKIKKKEQ